MQQIHQVVESSKEEWVLDPERGAIKELRRAMQQASTEVIKHEGQTYDIQPDGTFHVNDECAAFYLRMPGWHSGASPFPPKEMELVRPRRVERVADAGGDPV